MKDGKKILVVGQTPPPFGGQAIMIESMLKGNYKNIKLYHVRMAFSKEMNEIGKLNFFKFFHLFEVVARIIYTKCVYKPDILYFPPTGPNFIPFYRDAIILLLVRPFFSKVCFHFHASGISDLYPRLNFLSRLLFQKAYFYADIGIRLSNTSPEDPARLKAKKEVIIPNGISDHYFKLSNEDRSKTCSILFVGLLNETKGLGILIEAAHLLKGHGIDFSLLVMGKFESEEFRKQIYNLIDQYELENNVTFLGVLTGDEKFNIYAKADIFCFPSFFDAENFPVVLLEASSFALPLVSTDWRGIPAIVKGGENGFLVPVRNGKAVADKLQTLIIHPQLRMKMGLRARELYLEKYSLNQFYKNIESAFSSI